jgi:hypothetical protein
LVVVVAADLIPQQKDAQQKTVHQQMQHEQKKHRIVQSLNVKILAKP